jgi:hypothetical protein
VPTLWAGFPGKIRKKLQQLAIEGQQRAIELPCQYDEFGVVGGAARSDGQRKNLVPIYRLLRRARP